MIHTDGNPTIACGAGDRTNLTPHDFRIQDEGTIVVLHPLNDCAREWIGDHLYAGDDGPQWWGGGVVIEHRYAGDIITGIAQDGLTIQ